MSASRKVLLGLLLLVVITAVGVAGYRLIEGWSFFDALYMTIITISTVGYAEVHPLSTNGKIFTMVLIIGGVGGALYALSGIIQYIIEGQFGITLARRRMENRIGDLKGHFILCGHGRVGEEIALGFKEEGVPFVVIDSNSKNLAKADSHGYLYIEGDATRDEVLKQAGIQYAKGLVAAVGTDADNLYITLSARGLRPDLFIEARASDVQAEAKLKRAGADRVVSPHHIGGRRMAMLALRPAVVDFIDTVTRGRGREMLMESVDVLHNSRLVSETIRDLHRETGTTILAAWKRSGKFVANPAEEDKVEEGDRLIVVGNAKSLAALEDAAGLARPK